jgi:hypothetical protein
MGGRGQLTGGDRAQPAEPVELGEAECGLDGVVGDRGHAASRKFARVGSGSAGLGGSSAGAMAASQGESDSIVMIGPGTS